MGFGQVLSSCTLTVLPATYVCVLLMLTLSDARPNLKNLQNTEKGNDDRWKASKNHDSWRAFEPVTEISRTAWWKERLDDDLWNPKAHGEPSNSHENAVPTESNPIAATKTAVDSEGEKKVTKITSKLEAKTETSTAAGPMTDKPPVSDLNQPRFKKGEVNKFVDPEPGSDYSTRGEGYHKNSWNSAYSQPIPRNESAVSKEGTETPSSLEDKKTIVAEGVKETKNLQTSNSVEDNSLILREVPDKHKQTNDDTVHDSHIMKEKVVISNDVVNLNTEPVKELLSASSSEHTNVDNLSKNIVISNDDVSESSSVKKDKVGNSPQDHKVDTSIRGKSNVVSKQGESLSEDQTRDLKTVKKEKVNDNVTKKPHEVTTKKLNSEFVDWNDWDNSVFDYYDDDDDDVENSRNDKSEKIIKKNNIVASSENSKSHKKSKENHDVEIDNDDDDDNSNNDEGDGFYDDDEEYDDEDEVTDKNIPLEIIKNKDKNSVTTAIDDKEKDFSSKSHISTSPVKKIDFDTLVMQSDEAASHTDHSHYSKGIIYDINYPDHKPSVKKDLTNPVSLIKNEDLHQDSKIEDPSITGTSELQNVSVKKTLSVTHVQSGQLNTESDVSTSPNPPPPGVASSKESAGTMTPGTTPIPTSHQTRLAVDSLGSQKFEDNNGFILSFPLEFCRVDYECRAGRTCILGVCKCYTPSMCAGHYHPICGSDGVQYTSHCELHRTACVNRVHIRADRRGKCFQKEIEEHEKSWLMEQERLLQEDREKAKSQNQSTKIQSQNIVQYPVNAKQDHEASDVHVAPSKTSESMSTVTPKTTTTETVTKARRECTWKEMGKFKDDLLMYYCQKFVEPNCKEEVKTDREYLSMLMFSYYDKDYDYYLTAKELDDKERDEHFSNNIILNCHLHDFINYADNLEADGKLTVSEFTNSFEPPIPAIPLHAHVEVVSTLASAGNGLELKCGIDAETVVWRRHGARLCDDKRSHMLMVFDDGALFFGTVDLHHIGNYTCVDSKDESNAQIHRLKVQTVPVVEVTPVTQTHLTGSDIELNCYAESVPESTLTWKQGGEPLKYTSHITHYYGGGHIVIHNAQPGSDSGTFSCTASNQAGTTEKSVSVTVLLSSASSSKESSKMAGTFVVFHSKGISAYDPLSCLSRHEVSGDFGNFKFIPDALDGPLTLCHKADDCHWGAAVRVGSEFIVVSQPDQNRVVVMNAVDTLNPLQVIDTDKNPEKLWYVKHLDQVWVLCGSQKDGAGNKTIVVIRDASQHIQHRSVHTQPVGNHFDMVQDLFIAPPNDLNHEFDFGYVSHTGQNGLFKINLEDMSYTKSIDLTNYGCVPINVAFVPIGGHVVLQCVSAADQHTLQLTMDYLTDTITSATSHNGRPMTSPDSRYLVTVDMLTGKVIVFSISVEGVIETAYEATVGASISDVAFMVAMYHHGYDLVMTSADDNDIIILNLATRKVEKLKGSKFTENSNSWNLNPISRQIITGNRMSNFLMTPSQHSLNIIDVRFKQIECEFSESVGSDVMIYVPSIYTS